jgi:hypothetical protein
MSVQSNGQTTLGGVTGKGFMPGQSGNPGGRPKGLVRRIREETRDGDELVEFMVRVFRDEDAPRRDRIAAVEWLADRGWGKAALPIRQEVDVPTDSPFDQLTDEERDAVIQAVRRRIRALEAESENGQAGG